jgi:Protein of unknown function (DUF3499)
VARRCARPGCGRPATAALGFDARRQLAWLVAGADDGGTPVCERHADGLRVPNGWWLDDRRAGGEPRLFAPGAQEPGPPAEARWEPHFDPDDDLGGLLDATTPLLARAFGRRARTGRIAGAGA